MTSYSTTNVSRSIFPDTGLATYYPQKAVDVPDVPPIPPPKIHRKSLPLMDPELEPVELTEQMPVLMNVPAVQLAIAVHPPAKAVQLDVIAEVIVEPPLKVIPAP